MRQADCQIRFVLNAKMPSRPSRCNFSNLKIIVFVNTNYDLRIGQQQFDRPGLPNKALPMENALFVNWPETRIFVKREAGLVGHE